MADKKGLDTEALGAFIANEINQAIGSQGFGSTVAQSRETAMRYYLGQPFGNEIEDRSQVVITEVRDKIQSALPSLLKIFTAGDKLVQFEPGQKEDQETAEQIGDYVDHVINKDNPGFHILYSWFFDADLSKVGIVKWWWDNRIDVTEETYDGLTDVQFNEMLQDEEVTPIEHTETTNAMGETVHAVKVKKKQGRGKVCIENVPPEEFLIARDAKDIARARFVGHKLSMTVSDLRAMGFKEKDIEGLPSETDTEWTTEAQERRSKDDEMADSANTSTDPAMNKRTVVEGYYRVDQDGDGIAELRQIWSGPGGTPILRNEIWSGPRAPFASICPYPLSHRFFGLSSADMTMDIQLIKSTVTRQLLDNMYLTNNARYKLLMASPDGVNLDDFLQQRPGGGIRVKPGSDIVPLETAPIGPTAYPLLEYLEGVSENRTGVTRYNQGMDADSLNKTATGVSKIMGAAQERQLLTARIYAETGVRDLCWGVYQLISEYQDKPRTLRLRNKWVDVDPRGWAKMADVQINVGLGTNDKTQQAMQAVQMLQIQQQMVMGGLTHMVTPKEIYNTATKLVEAFGWRFPDPYFKDPSLPENPPPQPKPSPDEQKLQMEGQKMQMQSQMDQQKQQADMQVKQAELVMDAQRGQQEIQLEREKAAAQIQIAREKAQVDIEIARMKAQNDIEVGNMQAEHQAQLAEKTLAIKAQQGAFKKPNGKGAEK
jgi:hypothetical protein